MDKLNKYYPFLDGFRAIAIFIVLGHHMRAAFHLQNMFSNYATFFDWVYFRTWQIFHVDLSSFYLGIQYMINRIKGVLGVEMFLVISGFLITRILIGNGLTNILAGRFYIRRFFKIFPSYFLLIIVSLLFYVLENPQSLPDMPPVLFTYIVFLQNYFPRNPFLGHTWTLVVIEQFYVFCPLVILAVYHFFKSPDSRRKVLIGLCLSIMVVAPGIRMYYQAFGLTLLQVPWIAPEPVQTTLYRFDAIAFGCLLALLEPFFAKWPKSKKVGFGLWMGGMFLFYLLVFVIKWGYHTDNWYAYSLGYIAFGLVILAAYQDVYFLSRWKVLQWIGRHSYGIYLWHYLLLMVWGPWQGIIPISILIVGYLISSVVMGALSTWTIERYFLNIREKILPKAVKF